MLTCQIAGSAETDESDQTGHTARSTRADSAVRHPIAKVRQRTSIRLVARCSRLRAVLAARAAPAHETKTCRSARRVRLALASTALRTAAQRVPRQNTAVPQLRGLRVALPSGFSGGVLAYAPAMSPRRRAASESCWRSCCSSAFATDSSASIALFLHSSGEDSAAHNDGSLAGHSRVRCAKTHRRRMIKLTPPAGCRRAGSVRGATWCGQHGQCMTVYETRACPRLPVRLTAPARPSAWLG